MVKVGLRVYKRLKRAVCWMENSANLMRLILSRQSSSNLFIILSIDCDYTENGFT